MRESFRRFILWALAVASPLAAAPVKIMPVGDSITAGEHYGFPAMAERTGYRKPLFELLTAAGYEVDFVGSQEHGIRPAGAVGWYDWNCEAYPGWTIPQIAERMEVALASEQPDILLVHVGTNGKDWEQKPAQVAALLDRVNAHAVATDRAVTVLLGLIINRFVAEDPAPTTRFNQEVARLVAARTGDRIRIVLVDMERGAGLDYSDRLPDPDVTTPDEGGDMLGTRYPGVPIDRYHPNDKGNLKMARTFYGELVKHLGAPPARQPDPAAPAAWPLAPYLDPDQTVDTRVRDLLARLTLEEKASLTRNGSPGVPRLGVPRYDWWNEALHGVARAGEATVFPQAIGLAAMWDEPFLRRLAGVIGIEARAKHHDAVRQGRVGERYRGLTFWSPNINIFRDPRWGRGQETYGEDPFLTSRLGVAFVRGLQEGGDPRYLLTAACAKHFAVHSGPESSRHQFNVTPDEADLHETYLPAFEAVVREARVEAVMTAYNAVDGRPCAVAAPLYDRLARWGFDGHVVSDCGAIADLYETYRLAAGPAEAEALAFNAGLCLRCGEPPSELVEAVVRGLITEEQLDLRLGRLLRTLFRLGMFDPAERVLYAGIPLAANNTAEHAALALAAAEKSIVLLKNDGVLPLRRESLRRVLVVGPNADSLPALRGNYHGDASAPVTVLAGLRALLGPEVRVDHVRGCDYAEPPPGVRGIARTALRSGGDAEGLRGHYFDNPRLEGEPIARRRSRSLNLDFAKDRRPDGVPAENISVRWVGELIPPLGGEYELVVRARGGVRLKVGDAMVLDDWTPGEKVLSAKRALPEVERVPVVLEYFAADGPLKISLEWKVPDADVGFASAVAAAQEADAIVYVGGLTAELEGEEMELDYVGFEGGDRTRIELPPVQERLLAALQATGKPLAVVLMTGSAVALPRTESLAGAIVQAWYPGQAGGTAVANVLFGVTNPSGRLPVTFYRATEELAPFEDYHMANRTYRYFRGAPLYPFGHGLSYTTFGYANLRASVAEVPATPLVRVSSADGLVWHEIDGITPASLQVRVSVDITNTGARDGEEVVQLYANEPESWPARATRSLCGFTRVALRAGETKTVSLAVPEQSLRRWNPADKDYVIPRGVWRFSAGASSADLRAVATVEIR